MSRIDTMERSDVTRVWSTPGAGWLCPLMMLGWLYLVPCHGAAQSDDATLSEPATPAVAISEEERARQASALFERGVELYGEGNLDASLVQFERAYQLVPNPRLLYNLAQIQAERHHYVAAIALYEQYLRESGEDIPESRKVESLAQLDKLRERVAQLWVESDVSGAKLFVNDELVGTLPLSEPLTVDSGVCDVRVEKGGYTAARRKLKIAGGDQARVVVPLARVASSAAPADSTRAAAETPQRSYRAFFIASAAAAALGGTTLAMGLLTRQADAELDLALNRMPVRPRDLDRDRARLRTYAGLTDGFGLATLAAVGFALYFAIDPPVVRSERSASRTPVDGSRRRAVRSLHVAPSAAGLTLHGTF